MKKEKNWLKLPQDNEPVFWVSELRLLSVLSAKATAEIRKVEFKKGLNIIWSKPGDPKGDSYQRGKGHAAGKTSFSRAIRFILGEPTYGNKAIEERIINNKNLQVGCIYASVWINGKQWSVFRHINKLKKDFAVPGSAFDEAIKSNDSQAYKAFTETLHQATVGAFAVRHFDQKQTDEISWLETLLPISRDQEAHLSSIHKWRDISSQAEPPGLSPFQRAFIMRCLMGVADPDETTQLNIRNDLQEDKGRAERQITTYNQVIKDELFTLEEELEIEDEELDPKDLLFIESTKKRATSLADGEKEKLNDKKLKLKIDTKQESIESKKLHKSRIEGNIGERLEQLKNHENLLKEIASETKPSEATSSLCDELLKNAKLNGKYCTVPTEKAMEKCDLYWECRIKENLGKESIASELNANKKQLIQNITDDLKKELTPFQKQIALLEADIKTEEKVLLRAKSRSEEIDEKIKTINEKYQASILSARNISIALLKLETARDTIKFSDEKITTADIALTKIRKKSKTTQNKLSDIFDTVVQTIVNDRLSGTLTFNSIETTAAIFRSGELDSEAYKALRCIAYDFTALIARFHDLGHHPGFLLHDSPRESDLESSLYLQLFHFIHTLEKSAPNSFQYIVTTTEAPPEELQNDQYVRLELSSFSKEDRFYKEDL